MFVLVIWTFRWPNAMKQSFDNFFELQQAKSDEIALSEKLRDTARWMMSVSGKPEFESRQEVYFPILEDWRAAKKRLIELESKAIKHYNTSIKTEYAIELEERRALKEASVTSSTYERAQKRLFNEVSGFVCGK